MRKVYVEVKVKMIVSADDGVDISDVVNEMEYDFSSQTEGADILDTEILDWEITDSK